MTDLEQARLTINEVDQKMAELFCKRMEAVELVARYKSAHQMPIFDAAREEVVVKKNCAYIEQMRYLPYYEKFIRYEMGLSKDYQSTLIHSTVVGYFGAEGSHTHAAEQMLFPCEKSISFSTFEEIFDAVESGRIAYGVIPFENSNTGDVGNILDLLKTHNVYIRKMYDLKIRQCLLGLEGAPVSGVKTVFSHPQALSQCRDFLTQLSAKQVSSASTSEAAKHVAELRDPSCAAIGSAVAAELYGLSVLARDINTSSDNTTRFIIIAKSMAENGNRFSLLFTVHHEVGQLAGVMRIVSDLGFNLECIKSRPLKDAPWQYYFYIEVVGDLSGAAASSLLEQLGKVCTQIKVLGTYTIEKSEE